MALFVVRRNVEGLGQEDVDAAAYRAIMCSYEYPGMKWHRSYWDQKLGVLDCVYEAHDAEEIREHARRSRIPCDDIRRVEVIDPATYLSG